MVKDIEQYELLDSVLYFTIDLEIKIDELVALRASINAPSTAIFLLFHDLTLLFYCLEKDLS